MGEKDAYYLCKTLGDSDVYLEDITPQNSILAKDACWLHAF